MKIISIALTLLFGLASTLAAQEQGGAGFTSKNGHQVLPQGGDLAVTAGASTLLRFAGNFFGKTANNNNDALMAFPSRNFPLQVIGGKYFLSNTTAIRMAVNIIYRNEENKVRVNNDLSVNPDEFLYDRAVTTQTGALLAGGLEMRRGNSRVQGVYGFEAFAGYIGGQTDRYEYANPITTTNQAPSSTLWANITGLPAPSLGHRMVRQSVQSRLDLGVRAFVGAEYFFAPKLSLGGEFFWGLTYSGRRQEVLTYETYNPLTQTAVELTVTGEGVNRLNLGVDNLGGVVSLNFYF